MKVIIPMVGLGSRFKNAGYKDIKPLIKIHNKPIIEWVTTMFSSEDEFVFICRDTHLEHTNLHKVLTDLNLNSEIINIPGHKKGPMMSLNPIKEKLSSWTNILISYCDYFMNWDYEGFKRDINKFNPEGSIVCYKGFHPHLLVPHNVYAGCTQENGWLTAIKEKYSFTSTKTKGYHSVGLHYIKSGKLLCDMWHKMHEQQITFNNEYYVSMLYHVLLEHNHKIRCFDDVTHFCQWGTPYDLEDYLFWMKSSLSQKESA